MLNATSSRGAITCFLITERIENYIYVYVKDLYVHSFLHRRYFTNAPQGYLEVIFLIYSICNYVMYR